MYILYAERLSDLVDLTPKLTSPCLTSKVDMTSSSCTSRMYKLQMVRFHVVHVLIKTELSFELLKDTALPK